MTHPTETIKSPKTTEKEIQYYDYPQRSIEDIKTYLDRISEIIQLGAIESAICSEVFTLEAMMRLIAERQHLDFENKTPLDLLQIFHQKEILSAYSCELLSDAILLRDDIMKKNNQKETDQNFVETVFSIIQQVFKVQISEIPC